VDLNGTRVLTDFDTFVAAGGMKRAVDRTFAVNVTGGEVRIVFTRRLGSVSIAGVEVKQ
jgi:hypothetical protein